MFVWGSVMHSKSFLRFKAQKGISGSFPQCVFVVLFTVQLHGCVLGFLLIAAAVNGVSPFAEFHRCFMLT